LRDGANVLPLNISGTVSSIGGSTPSGTPSAVVRFAENFGTAVKRRTIAAFAGTEVSPDPSAQNVPGAIHNSESGIILAVPSVTVVAADSGTRFKAEFDGIPAGVSVWVGIVDTGLTSQKAWGRRTQPRLADC
jgi:hypothetical protein